MGARLASALDLRKNAGVRRVSGDGRGLDRPPLVAPRSDVFVGRERELGLLGASLSRGDSPSLFVLAGEPGIGKTRLAHQILDRPGA